MDVALRYNLLTQLSLFILFTLLILFTPLTLFTLFKQLVSIEAIMPLYNVAFLLYDTVQSTKSPNFKVGWS